MTDNADKGFFDRLGELLNTPLPGTQQPTGTQPSPGSVTPSAAVDDEAGLLAHIRDILNTPLPGTAQAGTSAAEPDGQVAAPTGAVADAAAAETPAPWPDSSAAEATTVASSEEQMIPPGADLAEGALDEDWWRRDWDAFKAHQTQEGRGLEMKQSQDRDKFAAFQEQERQRFAAHQSQEEAAFRHHQQWKLNTWRQYREALKSGRPLPPPPFALPPGAPMPPGMPMPPGAPMPGPMGGPGMPPPPPWMRRPR
jgi:hypothetical protein